MSRALWSVWGGTDSTSILNKIMWVKMLRLDELGDLPPLVLNGVDFCQADPVFRLGTSKLMTSVGREVGNHDWKALCRNLSCPTHSHSCLHHLSFGLVVWLPLKSTLKLIAGPECNIMGSSLYTYIILLFYDLHWLSISFWIQLNVLVITGKALHGTGPSYLWNHLSLVISACSDKL